MDDLFLMNEIGDERIALAVMIIGSSLDFSGARERY